MKKIATRRSSTNEPISVYLMGAWCIKQVRQFYSNLPHETIPNVIVNKFLPFSVMNIYCTCTGKPGKIIRFSQFLAALCHVPWITLSRKKNGTHAYFNRVWLVRMQAIVTSLITPRNRAVLAVLGQIVQLLHGDIGQLSSAFGMEKSLFQCDKRSLGPGCRIPGVY